jgi:hypothetical protein
MMALGVPLYFVADGLQRPRPFSTAIASVVFVTALLCTRAALKASEAPLEVTAEPERLARSYRSHYLRGARVACLPAELGLVGAVIGGHWFVYVLGVLASARLTLPSIAPDQADIAFHQRMIHYEGSPLSLGNVLLDILH